ncbi:MAG: hypothetical protein KA760_11265, partial [Steroidobacteraceae bacterium]|nr:hypothetical protein [Steroidobacteraceae bacterium]
TAFPKALRLLWVETTHQPVAAFGKRTFNVGFPAVSSKSCRSPPDPELPDDVFKVTVGYLIFKPPVHFSVWPTLSQPQPPISSCRLSGRCCPHRCCTAAQCCRTGGLQFSEPVECKNHLDIHLPLT